MPKKQSGLTRRKGSNVWQFEIRIPESLAQFHDGKRSHRVSLGTRDYREATAKAALLSAHWQTLFAEQRRQIEEAEPVQAVTPAMARDFAQQMLHDTLTSEDIRANHKERHLHMRVHAGLGVVGMQGAAQRLGVTMDEHTPGAREAALVYLSQLKATLLSLNYVEQPPAPTLTKPQKPRKLRDVFDKWKLAEGGSLKRKSVLSRESALKLYEKQSGNPNICTVTREDANAFKAWIVDRSISKASKTAKDRLIYVRALFTYAHEDLQWLESNPFLLISHVSKTEAPSENWTDEQVVKFFSLPLFQSYELRPTQGRSGADAAYWIPLLGLFTGARLGEIVQLTKNDLVKTGGKWFIDFDETEGKGLKTPASTRRVPLHSELLRLGLTDYASDMPDKGRKSLWPELHLNAERPSHGFSVWFAEEPRKWVPGTPMFKWLRNTVETVLVEAEVQGPIRARLLGHAVRGHEGDRTYAHPTAILRTSMERVQYPGLTLPRAYKPGKAIADAQAGAAAAVA